MRKLTTIILLTLFGQLAKAQQDIQVTQFMYDRLSINPGVAGVKGQACFSAIVRKQWVGADGAPVSTIINGHVPVRSVHGGIGATIYSDVIGNYVHNVVKAAYSYHIKSIGAGTLGLGGSIGAISGHSRKNYVYLDGGDAVIPSNGSSSFGLDFNLGAYYQSNQFYLGLSVTHISEQKLKNVSYTAERHYYIMAGYNYFVNSSQDWIIRPSTLIKTDFNSTQFDFNVTVTYKSFVWAGVSYRLNDAFAPMIGMQKPEMFGGTVKIGYAYDVTTSKINQHSSGSHELLLNFCFDPSDRVKQTKTQNPIIFYDDFE